MCKTGFNQLELMMYYCTMEYCLTGMERKCVKLDDGREYFYSVKEVEITNILGVAVAVLKEYLIKDSSGEMCVLHKTNEGNWYEIQDTNKGVDKNILLALKLKIDNQ